MGGRGVDGRRKWYKMNEVGNGQRKEGEDESWEGARKVREVVLVGPPCHIIRGQLQSLVGSPE